MKRGDDIPAVPANSPAPGAAPEPTGERGEVLLPLCGHGIPPVNLGDRAECPSCGSFWDLSRPGRRYRYDGSYPGARGHHDAAVGRLKVRTLSRYLDVTATRLDGRNVCEVGFGGGHCLAFMAGRARNAVGIESVPENVDHAAKLGIPRAFLHLDGALPATLPVTIDLWVFLDSFEHIGDPADFLAWMVKNSGSSARALLVAPDGGSLTARLMKRRWPHRLPDHPFHWTRKGITEFFDRYGFRLVRSFYPWKYVSPWTIYSHAMMMFFGEGRNATGAGRTLRRMSIRLNAGEMGLVFQRGWA